MNIATISIVDQQAVVNGVIDFDTVLTLRTMGEKYIDEQQSVVFDFNQVSRANSAGLTLLLVWLRRARQQQKTIRFVHVPASLKTVAHVCDATAILGMA
jgi:phospholipid transport system transporter-binding protein